MAKKDEDLYLVVQAHHLGGGESVSFKCPHCNKKITVSIRERPLDADSIQVFWGKNYKDVEKKTDKADNEG